MDSVTPIVKERGEFNKGVTLHTVLFYRVCMKGRCGGIGGVVRPLLRPCSKLHWVVLDYGPRKCLPTPGTDDHPRVPTAFIDREAAEAAFTRCADEHIDEHEHPEKHLRR